MVGGVDLGLNCRKTVHDLQQGRLKIAQIIRPCFVGIDIDPVASQALLYLLEGNEQCPCELTLWIGRWGFFGREGQGKIVLPLRWMVMQLINGLAFLAGHRRKVPENS